MTRAMCLGVLLVGLCASRAVHAQSLDLAYLELAMPEDGPPQVSAVIDMALPQTVSNALHSGIDLTFSYEVEFNQNRNFIWDATLWTHTGQFVLGFRPLRERYVLNDAERGITKAFYSLDHAVSFLRNFTLELPVDGAPAGADRLRMRVWLDRDALPPPLRLPGFLDEDWKVDTGWRSTRLAAPTPGP